MGKMKMMIEGNYTIYLIDCYHILLLRLLRHTGNQIDLVFWMSIKKRGIDG